MIEPHSAQLGESALTLNATFVLAPSDAVMAATAACPFPLPFPFEYPLANTGSGATAGDSAAIEMADTSLPEAGAVSGSDVDARAGGDSDPRSEWGSVATASDELAGTASVPSGA